MSRLWRDGDPIEVELDPDSLPRAFYWRGAWRQVACIANRWRVRAGWWSEEVWREYFKLTTADGLLCTIYRDLHTGAWFCARLYD
jgi:Domain of unknown function (DUF6504)